MLKKLITKIHHWKLERTMRKVQANMEKYVGGNHG